MEFGFFGVESLAHAKVAKDAKGFQICGCGPAVAGREGGRDV